jgi:hypothetical protein
MDLQTRDGSWVDRNGVLDSVRWNVDFVDFWGVFPSVGREKIDYNYFDGNGSFLREFLGGEDGVASWDVTHERLRIKI